MSPMQITVVLCLAADRWQASAVKGVLQSLFPPPLQKIVLGNRANSRVAGEKGD